MPYFKHAIVDRDCLMLDIYPSYLDIRCRQFKCDLNDRPDLDLFRSEGHLTHVLGIFLVENQFLGKLGCYLFPVFEVVCGHIDGRHMSTITGGELITDLEIEIVLSAFLKDLESLVDAAGGPKIELVVIPDGQFLEIIKKHGGR